MRLLRLRRLHDLLVVVVVVLLQRGEVLELVLHHLRRRKGEEQWVVGRRCGGGHGAEADGLGALLGERIAEGAVLDEAIARRGPAAAQTGTSPPRKDAMALWKGRDRGREKGDADDRWAQG